MNLCAQCPLAAGRCSLHLAISLEQVRWLEVGRKAAVSVTECAVYESMNPNAPSGKIEMGDSVAFLYKGEITTGTVCGGAGIDGIFQYQIRLDDGRIVMFPKDEISKSTP